MTDPLYAEVGVPFNAEAVGQFSNQLPDDLVGTITVAVYDARYPTTGTAILTPTTAGITMILTDGEPTYQATLTVPVPAPTGEIVWGYPGNTARQALVVSPGDPEPTTFRAQAFIGSQSSAGRQRVPRFLVGQGLPVWVRFTDPQTDEPTAPVEPVTITFDLPQTNPPATPRTLTMSALSESEYYAYTPLDTPGYWAWRATSSGSEPGVDEGTFQVVPTRLRP